MINCLAFSVCLLSNKTPTRLKFLNMEKEMEKLRRKMAMMRDRLSSHTFHMSTLAGDWYLTLFFICGAADRKVCISLAWILYVSAVPLWTKPFPTQQTETSPFWGQLKKGRKRARKLSLFLQVSKVWGSFDPNANSISDSSWNWHFLFYVRCGRATSQKTQGTESTPAKIAP